MSAACRVCLLLSAVLMLTLRPALATRKLVSKTGGLIHSVGQRRLLQENPCGSFAADDPWDGILNGQQTPKAHQPCYDVTGTKVLYCCSSGSTQCACAMIPPTEFGPFICHNYVDNTDQNHNTGDICLGFAAIGAPPLPTPPIPPPPPVFIPDSPPPPVFIPDSPPPPVFMPDSPPPPTFIDSFPPPAFEIGNPPPFAFPGSPPPITIPSPPPTDFPAPPPTDAPVTPPPTDAPVTPPPTDAPVNPPPPSVTFPFPPPSIPGSPPPVPCVTMQPIGVPGPDGTCGMDTTTSQMKNLCTNSLGYQYCCPSTHMCPMDPNNEWASNPLFAQQVYCEPVGPCGY